jgi:energy-coupling factor transport system substrate-specific component
MPRRAYDPRILAVIAIMTAIVFVLTRLVQVPTPIGYIHLGDIGIFFGALAFGPWVGAVAGGLGTALADLTSPYAQWAIFSLIIHGAQGWLAGWIGKRLPGAKGVLLATITGAAVVVVGYLLAGTILVGWAGALTEVPLNILQVAVGGIVAAPLYALVRAAYPPITRFGTKK